MVCSTVIHILERNQRGPMIIQDESVLNELLDEREISSDYIQVAIWSHCVSALLWECKGILYELALTVVVQDFVGVDEFRARLEEVDPRDDLLSKPTLNLKLS